MAKRLKLCRPPLFVTQRRHVLRVAQAPPWEVCNRTVTTDLDAATFLLAVLAFLLSVGAILYTRRATRASEQSAEASSRSAAVAERAEQREVEEAAERAVRWRFAPGPRVVFSGMPLAENADRMTQMVNEGESTAYDVRVELHEGPQVIGGPLLHGATVHSNEWVRLARSTAGYGEHQELRVYWRVGSNGPVRSRHFDLRGRAL